MLLDKYGIKLLYVMYFSINMSGVDDNVENYQTYLISCSVLWCSSPMESYFFFVLSLISRILMIFMLNYAFTHILFSLRILFLAV